MDFKEVTDLLASAFRSHREVADALGVEFQHYRQMRLSPENRGSRPPPEDWQHRLAPLAENLEAHSEALRSLARSLRASS